MTFSSSADIARRGVDCIHDAATAEGGSASRPVHAVGPEGLAGLMEALAPAQAGWLRQSGFAAKAGEVALLPGGEGVAGAVLGLGKVPSFLSFGVLPGRLPADTAWRLEPGPVALAEAALGWCMGAYGFASGKPAGRAPARLVAPEGCEEALAVAGACWMARDLINTPANLLGPAELAGAVAEVGRGFGASVELVEGAALEAAYPTVAAVGRGSVRKPVVAVLRWAGSGVRDAGADAPLVSLCGKGVCFDTGGYDLKSPAGMLRMKKDMGGAAITLGVARLIMQADLPVRLALRVGCVENSVSGESMRPSDVVRTRRGLHVEIGNTDAEGRLVLCDLLAEASDESPNLLIDCATLTGAARTALGPDLPAMFCNQDDTAAIFERSGRDVEDPIWRLPLWEGYETWLKSDVADFNNVASKPMAGAIVAALFLQKFVTCGTDWVHFDVYAWNDSTRPGRPEGAESQAMRCIYAAVRQKFLPNSQPSVSE